MKHPGANLGSSKATRQRALKWRAQVMRDQARSTGIVSVREKNSRGNTTHVRIGSSWQLGGTFIRQSNIIAWRIRSAFKTERMPPVIVMDAAGKVIATIDPVTRVRTPCT